jgi:ribosome-associated protein
MSTHRTLPASLFIRELSFSTSRSSGPGGQNVNKVNTKVTLKFTPSESQVFTEEEKTVVLHKLHSKLTREGVLVISAQEKRSQLQNKEVALVKFERMLAKAFEKKKVRKATKPSKGAVQERITKKKRVAEKKKWRKLPE